MLNIDQWIIMSSFNCPRGFVLDGTGVDQTGRNLATKLN